MLTLVPDLGLPASLGQPRLGAPVEGLAFEALCRQLEQPLDPAFVAASYARLATCVSRHPLAPRPKQSKHDGGYRDIEPMPSRG